MSLGLTLTQQVILNDLQHKTYFVPEPKIINLAVESTTEEPASTPTNTLDAGLLARGWSYKKKDNMKQKNSLKAK